MNVGRSPGREADLPEAVDLENAVLDAPGGGLALAAGRFAVALPCGVGVAAGGVAVAFHVLGHREVDGPVVLAGADGDGADDAVTRLAPVARGRSAAVVVAVVDHDAAPPAATGSSLGRVSLPDATASERSSRSFLALGEHR